MSVAAGAPTTVLGVDAANRTAREGMLIWSAIGISIVAALVRFWVSYRTHSLGEDALITLRYAENIAAGRGWVYNPGERVLGTTTPLFTVLLAELAWLHLPAMQAGIAIDIVADAFTCFLIARLMARPEIGRPAAGLFAAAIYAVSSTPISVSIGGMETALVTCVGMAAITASVAGRIRYLCLCGALLFLLRIDGLLLFGLLLAGYVVRTRRVPWPAITLLLLTTAPWLLFATLYFGSPIPASVRAKLTVYSHTAATPGSFTNTRAFNSEAFRNQFYLGWPQRIVSALFLVGAGLIGYDAAAAARRARSPSDWKPVSVRRGAPSSQPDPAEPRRAEADLSLDTAIAETARSPESETAGNPPRSRAGTDILLVSLLWVGIYYGTMATSRVPAFPWYFLPPWPVFLIIAIVGAEFLLGLVRQKAYMGSRSGGLYSASGGERIEVGPFDGGLGRGRPQALEGRVLPVVLVGLLLAGLVHVRSIERDIATAQEREDTLRRPLGLWLRDHVAPNERVLLEPIGYAGYYSGRRILDMVGLVSPEVLKYYTTPHALSGIVTGLGPEWLCLRGSERDLLHEQEPSLPDSAYDLVQPFPPTGEPVFYLYHRHRSSAARDTGRSAVR